MDRLILHNQSKESDAEPYACECCGFHISVNNFTGTLPSFLLLNGHHFNEARSTLQILLHQLQEELVLKLLLPTEPPTPSPMTSFNGLGEIRSFIPFNSTKQHNCDESRPLLEGFKRLFNFNNSALDGVQEPHSKSNSQNVHPIQIDEVSFHPFSCSIENSRISQDNQENSPLPRVMIDRRNDYDSVISMESLLPMSPIGDGIDDLTSVQLDRLQVANKYRIILCLIHLLY